jgi:hypothetical protein
MRRISRLSLPDGLADFSSCLDWPRDVLAGVDMRWVSAANIGLGLRWRAALSEMDRYFAFSTKLRDAILRRFASEIRRAAVCVERLQELSDGAPTIEATPPSILSFVATHRDGAPFSVSETAALCVRLMRPLACRAPSETDKTFHVGQPVAVGGRAALRVCVSAPMISEIAERVAEGSPFEAAFQPWTQDLALLFDRLAGLIDAFAAPGGRAGLDSKVSARHER